MCAFSEHNALVQRACPCSSLCQLRAQSQLSHIACGHTDTRSGSDCSIPSSQLKQTQRTIRDNLSSTIVHIKHTYTQLLLSFYTTVFTKQTALKLSNHPAWMYFPSLSELPGRITEETQTHLASQGPFYDPHEIYSKRGIPLKYSESLPTSLICTSRCPV